MFARTQCVCHALLAVIVAIAVSSMPALGQSQSKLTAADGATGDWFGYALALDGDRVLIGACRDDDNGYNSGSAYVFEKQGTVWVQTAKLTVSDGAVDDSFGYSVALEADRALIGACYDDDNGWHSGSAYVFEKQGSLWVQTAKLTADDGAIDDHFGWCVALDGNRALIGAPYGYHGTASGSAYVFEKQGGVWTEVAKLTAADAGGDCFGCSVALDGDRALIGAYGDDENGDYSGSACIFEKQGGVWVQTANLTADDGAAWDWFGLSVALDADRALIGAPYDDHGSDCGSAYVFEKQDGVWTEVAKLTAGDAGADDFGGSVALGGERGLIGAHYDDDNGFHSGSAYVFEKQGALWVEAHKLLAADGAARDGFGGSVALEGDRALVGACGDDDNGSASGSAYVFRRCLGDIDHDWDTDHADLGALLSAWDSQPGDPNWNPNADLDANGHVGHGDLGILLGDWGCGT